MLDGILYRASKDFLTGKKRHQFIVPSSLIKDVLEGVHDTAGHQGQARTLYLARQRFFWVGMEQDVREHVKCCRRCVVSKTPEPEGRAPLESIRTTRPLELVCMDFWSAEDLNGRSVDVLVVTDHFTKMAHAFPCRDQSAKQVARQLWDRYFCIYGFPERIHSDQGANFESQLIQELMQVAGVMKSRTTAYHPMGNGQAERFNRTLGGMIRALPPRAKQKWPQVLQTLTFAYNCTAHESTGYAPFYLMFGRIPRLPVDVMFHNVERDNNHVDYDSFVKRMRDDLKEALLVAQANATDSQRHQAELYNLRIKGCDIEVGDQVLLANKGERGRRKLADKWESTPYIVESKDPRCHVYHVRNTSSGHVKVVHRNLLLQANFLPLEVGDECSFTSEPEVSQVHSENSGRTQSVLDSVIDSAVRTVNWVAEVTDTVGCAEDPQVPSGLEVSEPVSLPVNNSPCDDSASNSNH
uniref:Gypsy retrotransposon integrase-like protein 1 n=1 Tax=Denticeps clupeoides TaxID=299321 RepID=A0AAY4A1Q4_9TELE